MIRFTTLFSNPAEKTHCLHIFATDDDVKLSFFESLGYLVGFSRISLNDGSDYW